MNHNVTIHNVERHKATGGISFVLRCCGEHEHTVHIQQPGKFTREELARVVEDHKAGVAEQHQSHIVAEEFICELAGMRSGECRECE